MAKVQNQYLPFSQQAEQSINKVCFFLIHGDNLIFIVRHHAKDNSVSVEPGGGKIDPKANGDMETPDEAIIREAEQELGVDVIPQSQMAVETHPYTGKQVAYYACVHKSGTPYNKADDEHLGIIEVPIRNIETYEDLKLIALDMAQKIVEEAHTGEELSRPIEFRVPEKAIMSFLQQFTEEPGAAFKNIPEEKSPSTPKPA